MKQKLRSFKGIAILLVGILIILIGGQALISQFSAQLLTGDDQQEATPTSYTAQLPEGSVLLFVSQDNGLVQASTSNNQTKVQDVQPDSSSTECINGLHGSPNGQWAAMDTGCGHSSSTMQLIDLSTGHDVILPVETGSRFLNWTPDGNSVIVRTDSYAENALQVIDVTTGEAEVLSVPAYTYDAAISPGEEWILYTVTKGIGFGGELWMVDRDGENKQLVLREQKHLIVYANWSPAGEQLAYIRIEDSTTPFTIGELWVADESGSNRRKIADADAGHGYRPVWSPDGQKIAWIARENPQSEAADFKSDALESNIYVWNMQTQQAKSITSFTGVLTEEPVWSPDGEYLIFSQITDGQPDLWQVDIATGQVQQLTFGTGAAQPIWGVTEEDLP